MDGTERYSDDSEPQGTAGIPMLEVFRRESVQNAVCVVTRYFGGVLLGTGGLLRAYTKAAKDALSASGVSAVRRWAVVDIPCTYAALERIKNELAAIGGVLSHVVYGADVTVKALIPEGEVEALAARVTDLTAGVSMCVVVGFEERAVRVQ